MSKVRQHAEDQLRTHLMKRHKVKDRKAALCRFPRRDLYERYGLYKVSGTAGWRSAHASRCRASESRVRENRMHGLMKEGERKPIFYFTRLIKSPATFWAAGRKRAK